MNPNKIQMLVDGECSHETRAEVLREIDSEPGQWRTLALALLEEQQWSKELSIVPQKPAIQQPLAHPLVHSEPLRSASSSAWRVPNWLPALAASVLLAVGFYGGTFLPNRDTPTVDMSQQGESLVSTSNEPIDYSAMKVVVTGPDAQKAEIPIYGQNEMGLMWAKEDYEIAKANQRLRKKGFELDVRPEYYTGKLNDGRQLVVPVKHVGLKPYGL